MRLTKTEIDTILSKVTGKCVDQNELRKVGFALDDVEVSHQLVEALLANQSVLGKAGEAGVSRTMQILEEIANESMLIGCVFMAHLWPIANSLRMHDVCDSIDLWIWNGKSPELSRQLLILANSQTQGNIRRHFEQLAK